MAVSATRRPSVAAKASQVLERLAEKEIHAEERQLAADRRAVWAELHALRGTAKADTPLRARVETARIACDAAKREYDDARQVWAAAAAELQAVENARE